MWSRSNRKQYKKQIGMIFKSGEGKPEWVDYVIALVILSIVVTVVLSLMGSPQ